MEANYTLRVYNEYKARNILSLADRVEVIREHDNQLPRPSLQSLAQKFGCSSKQIKNILLNRELILESYRKTDETDGSSKQANKGVNLLQKRQEKITFLGKVMYEYLQRALYFNYTIDDNKFRQKALQIKECIAVENFQPTLLWLEDFKRTYGIPAFDSNSLRNNIVITEAKRPYLNAIDIIQYVSRMEQEDSQRKESSSKDNLTKTHKKPIASPLKQPHNREELVLKRQDKLVFLGKVMYEYLQRVLYFKHNINEDKFRRKALQIKENLGIDHFQPTQAWVEDFKRSYGIPGFDLKSLHKNIVITEAKRPYLVALDMIQYVNRMEQFFQSPMDSGDNLTKQFTKADENNSGGNSSPENCPTSLEPKVIFEIEDDEEDEELQTLNIDDGKQQHQLPTVTEHKTAAKRSLPPFPDIESVDEALRHLKALEEYAMLQDNFRMIGLITQLEQILKKKENK